MAQQRGLIALGGKKTAPVPVTKGPVVNTVRNAVTPAPTRQPAPVNQPVVQQKPLAYADQRDAARRQLRAGGMTPDQIRAQIDAAKAGVGAGANQQQTRQAVLGGLQKPAVTTSTTSPRIDPTYQNPGSNGIPHTPEDIAQDQGKLNQDTAGRGQLRNTVNTKGPDGTVTTTFDENGNPIQTTELSDEEQRIKRNEQGFQAGNYGNLNTANGTVQNTVQNPFSFDFNNERQRLEDTTYDTFARRNEPRFKQEQDQFEQDMANRGIPPGSELYGRLKSELNQSQSDARLDARSKATEMAGNELSRSYGIARDSRKVPFEELSGLYALSRGEKTPQGYAPGSYNEAPANYEGSANNYNNLVGSIAENDKNRDFQGDQARKDREFQRRQNKLTREQQERLARMGAGRGGGGGGTNMDDLLAQQEYLAGIREQERNADIAAKKKAGGDPFINGLIGGAGAFGQGYFGSLGTKLGSSF